MKWTANKVMIMCMVLLLAAILTIMIAAPKSTWNPTCYKGYRYNVDSLGVMRPIETKYGVQKCLGGDVDVSK